MSIRALESKTSDVYLGVQNAARGLSGFATRTIARIDAGTLNADVMIRDTIQQLMAARDALVDSSTWTVQFQVQLATYASGQGNNPSDYISDYNDLRTAVIDAIAEGSNSLARDGSGNILYLQIDPLGNRTEAAISDLTVFRALMVSIVDTAG